MAEFDFKRLADEAAAETYDPRARRCWFWSHEWTMWVSDPTGRQQTRRCLKCGRVKVSTLFKTCRHTWVTQREGPIVNSDDAKIGYYYIQYCQRCGDVRRHDLK